MSVHLICFAPDPCAGIMVATNQSLQEDAVATELQYAYKSAVRSALPNYMKLRQLDHAGVCRVRGRGRRELAYIHVAAAAAAGLEEAQERISRLRCKWDTRHTYLCEQQQEASQVSRMVLAGRV